MRALVPASLLLLALPPARRRRQQRPQCSAVRFGTSVHENSQLR